MLHKKVAGFSWVYAVDIDAKDDAGIQRVGITRNIYRNSRMSVPGILSAARYRGSQGWPAVFLACYETGKRVGDADAGVYRPAADAVGTESLAVRDWEEFDTHCRGTNLPGRHRNA